MHMTESREVDLGQIPVKRLLFVLAAPVAAAGKSCKLSFF